MKLDATINHGKGSTFEWLTLERQDEIQKFVDKVYEDNKLSIGQQLEKVIEFANTTVEAALIWGWVEARRTADELSPENQLEKFLGK